MTSVQKKKGVRLPRVTILKTLSAYWPWTSVALIVIVYVASESGTSPYILPESASSLIPGGNVPATTEYLMRWPSGS